MFEVGFVCRVSPKFPSKVKPVYSSPSLSSLYNRFFKRVLDVFLVLLAAPFVLPLVLLMGLTIRRDGGLRLLHPGPHRPGWPGCSASPQAAHHGDGRRPAKLAAHLAADPKMRAEWEETQAQERPRITASRPAAAQDLARRAAAAVERGEGRPAEPGGPAPDAARAARLYPGRALYKMRPGLTGPWQVSDRNTVSFAGRADFDAAYAREMSLVRDLTLMFLTVWVVVRGTGYTLLSRGRRTRAPRPGAEGASIRDRSGRVGDSPTLRRGRRGTGVREARPGGTGACAFAGRGGGRLPRRLGGFLRPAGG